MRNIPKIGLGTWKLRGKECSRVVGWALDLGYRHIDTAHIYENHQAIGAAIKGFDRKKLFLTSKFFLDQKDVEKSCHLALKELGTSYLDLFLIHWPDRKKPMAEVLKQMGKLKKEGLIKGFGVSNFTIHHLQDMLKEGIKVGYNQVEFHPYLYQKELLSFCKKKKTQLIAYRPLGKGELVKEPLFISMGKTHGKKPAQIILRWIFQKDVPFIAKSATKKHLAENLDILRFSLTPQEMKKIDSLHKEKRFCKAEWSDFDY